MRCRPVKHSMGYLQKSFSLVPYMGVMRQRPHILGNGAAPPQRSRTEPTAEYLIRQECRRDPFILRLLLPIAVPQVKCQPGDSFARTSLPAVSQRLRARYTTPASQINDGSGSWYLAQPAQIEERTKIVVWSTPGCCGPLQFLTENASCASS